MTPRASWGVLEGPQRFWILFVFFIVFRSMVFVNRGGEFFVKPLEFEGFQFGPLRIFQETHDEKVGFGR